MELLVVGARLSTCALSNKNEATVIKTRLGCFVLQKWSKSSPKVLHGKNEATVIKTRLRCVLQKWSKSTPWSSPMEYSIHSFDPKINTRETIECKLKHFWFSVVTSNKQAQ